MDKQGIIKRADELITQAKGKPGLYLGLSEAEKILFGAISIISYCYGDNSKQIEFLLDVKKKFGHIRDNTYEYQVKNITIGILENLKSDINLGLLNSIEKQTAGEIFIDMLSLAKKLIDEGHKESAAVLACGAFEDTMKKLAKQNGIDVDGADITNVINALKAKSIMKSIQSDIAKSHVQLRNKAFHAQWAKIDIPEVKSLIAFNEEIILQKFTENY